MSERADAAEQRGHPLHRRFWRADAPWTHVVRRPGEKGVRERLTSAKASVRVLCQEGQDEVLEVPLDASPFQRRNPHGVVA